MAMTPRQAEQLSDMHRLVTGRTRTIDLGIRTYETGQGPSRTLVLLETRERRIAIDIPLTAIDDTISALCALRSKVVGELGAGSASRRSAGQHGTWAPKGTR